MNIVLGLLLITLGLLLLVGTRAFRIVISLALLYIGWQTLTPLIFRWGAETMVLF